MNSPFANDTFHDAVIPELAPDPPAIEDDGLGAAISDIAKRPPWVRPSFTVLLWTATMGFLLGVSLAGFKYSCDLDLFKIRHRGELLDAQWGRRNPGWMWRIVPGND